MLAYPNTWLVGRVGGIYTPPFRLLIYSWPNSWKTHSLLLQLPLNSFLGSSLCFVELGLSRGIEILILSKLATFEHMRCHQGLGFYLLLLDYWDPRWLCIFHLKRLIVVFLSLFFIILHYFNPIYLLWSSILNQCCGTRSTYSPKSVVNIYLNSFG